MGRIVLRTGLLLDAILLVGLILALFFTLRVWTFEIGFAGIPVTVAGILILVLVWIVEGSAADPASPRSAGSRPDDPRPVN